ncbi:hypothetical protein LOTGIDRAFT_157521 [Lottia gigantea]|uniref:Uncharacterized protein n=1 Tax=Lottia gigantea TaxID=225164 RepID=V4B5N5_LOTGI|nr:hypothetical protein LOTGIDRAFT_157521 [Lottia gigantea]ESP01342.1 hypothetical protein LOTGIDRAFT_157521 [Lottia gigantea]
MTSISSGVVASDEISADLMSAEEVDEVALNNYIEERLTSDKKKYHDPIKQVKSKTFSSQLKMKAKTQSGKEVILQSDRKLFSRLLIIGQQRSIDLKEVLRYSLGPVSYPLASANGSIAKTNKAALLHLIENSCKNCTEDGMPK